MGISTLWLGHYPLAQAIMFWAGIGAAALGLALLFWPFQKQTTQGPQLDNRGGAFVGGDNAGPITVHHGDIIHHAPQVPEKDNRVFVPEGTTLDSIFRFYDDNTDLQAHALTKHLIGRWMRVSGCVGGVMPFNGWFVQVSFEERYGKHNSVLFCLFREEVIADLQMLRHGDNIIVEGNVRSIERMAINLDNCKIISVSR